MDRLIYTAMTGASATMSRQASVAHNLANVATHGYRAEEHRLRAAQVLTHNSPQALPTRAFVVDASTHTDYSEGALNYTGGRYDVAVRGKGWIALAMPDGSEALFRLAAFAGVFALVAAAEIAWPYRAEAWKIVASPGSAAARRTIHTA